MPRPKGSKNKTTSAQAMGVATMEQLEAAKAEIQDEISTLNTDLEEMAQLLKSKKADLKAAQKALAALEKQEAALAEQAAKEKRQEEANTLAAAFLDSGKSLEEILKLLENA